VFIMLSSAIQHYVVLHSKSNGVHRRRIHHGLGCGLGCGPECGREFSYRGFPQVDAFRRWGHAEMILIDYYYYYYYYMNS
jgi:hypothetical protein